MPPQPQQPQPELIKMQAQVTELVRLVRILLDRQNRVETQFQNSFSGTSQKDNRDVISGIESIKASLNELALSNAELMNELKNSGRLG